MKVFHRRLHAKVWCVLAFVLPALLITFALFHRFAQMSTAFYAKPQVVLSVPQAPASAPMPLLPKP